MLACLLVHIGYQPTAALLHTRLGDTACGEGLDHITNAAQSYYGMTASGFLAGSMAKAAVRASRGEPTAGLRLTTSPSMDHFHVRSDSADSLASLDAMHETDSLVPRRPTTLPH